MPLMTKRNFIDGMNQPGKRPREARKKPPPIAVALQQSEGLPVVRASGRGQLAEQILALAFISMTSRPGTFMHHSMRLLKVVLIM